MSPSALITVHVPGPLRASAGASELTVSATSVRDLLEELARSHPALHRDVCDETGTVRRHVNLFVNTNHMQIVLTCDRPVGEIENLEHRLVSRFEWGLVTDLQPPDLETRLAILRMKEKGMGMEIPEENLNFLAARIRSNTRRLEGARKPRARSFEDRWILSMTNPRMRSSSWRCSNELSSTNLTVCGCGSITSSFEVRWHPAAGLLAAVRTLSLHGFASRRMLITAPSARSSLP